MGSSDEKINIQEEIFLHPKRSAKKGCCEHKDRGDLQTKKKTFTKSQLCQTLILDV